ncbi:hypothetical protein C8N35_101837 [Breoghania corrubedonensis]|uniref:Membrane protein DUF2157 n=1 Tax=Breoghania corrubedonensis TaxID=665038 RepID=A0A2T5VGA7_9HYPH|nr:hypothetical protein [Breoghania corrubedonensis]PTW62789.1 hypothetical protein C8N35_101837 [Breoghania corrubedonensis]
MLDREELQSAVDAGLLTPIQADALVAHYARTDETSADREEVRFARGFHDVFISIGLVIFFVGLFLGIPSLLSFGQPKTLATYGPATVIAWLLAEWLAGRRKLALPAILLSVLFTWFFAVTATAIYGHVGGRVVMTSDIGNPLFGPFGFDWGAHDKVPLVFGLAAFFGGALYYGRFKVPIALSGLVAGALVTLAALIETASPGLVLRHVAPFLLAAGLICFALAMYFDARDLARTTLNTDKAFWLHLMAAPLIMHSVLAMIRSDTGTTGEAVAIIAVVLVLGIVALVVDRRALLVSGLVYLGVAIFNLLKSSNVDGQTGIAASLLILGLFILTLGSGWTSVRRLVLAPFSGSRLFDYVPPIRTRVQ